MRADSVGLGGFGQDKSASEQNALKQKLCAQAILLPGEDAAAYEAFRSDFCIELAPAGTLQTTLVLRAAELAWKLKRLPVVEGAILQAASAKSEAEAHGAGGMGDWIGQLLSHGGDGILLRLQRYETRIERSLHGCLRELRLLQADGRAAGAFAAVGSGSFRTTGSGSFRQEGGREAAKAREAAPPARGPSAAPQDDGLSGSFGQKASGAPHGSSGSFDSGAVGSFRTEVSGSFGSKARASVKQAAAAAAPIFGATGAGKPASSTPTAAMPSADVAAWVRSTPKQ